MQSAMNFLPGLFKKKQIKQYNKPSQYNPNNANSGTSSGRSTPTNNHQEPTTPSSRSTTTATAVVSASITTNRSGLISSIGLKSSSSGNSPLSISTTATGLGPIGTRTSSANNAIINNSNNNIRTTLSHSHSHSHSRTSSGSSTSSNNNNNNLIRVRSLNTDNNNNTNISITTIGSDSQNSPLVQPSVFNLNNLPPESVTANYLLRAYIERLARIHYSNDSNTNNNNNNNNNTITNSNSNHTILSPSASSNSINNSNSAYLLFTSNFHYGLISSEESELLDEFIQFLTNNIHYNSISALLLLLQYYNNSIGIQLLLRLADKYDCMYKLFELFIEFNCINSFNSIHIDYLIQNSNNSNNNSNKDYIKLLLFSTSGSQLFRGLLVEKQLEIIIYYINHSNNNTNTADGNNNNNNNNYELFYLLINQLSNNESADLIKLLIFLDPNSKSNNTINSNNNIDRLILIELYLLTFIKLIYNNNNNSNNTNTNNSIYTESLLLSNLTQYTGFYRLNLIINQLIDHNLYLLLSELFYSLKQYNDSIEWKLIYYNSIITATTSNTNPANLESIQNNILLLIDSHLLLIPSTIELSRCLLLVFYYWLIEWKFQLTIIEQYLIKLLKSNSNNSNKPILAEALSIIIWNRNSINNTDNNNTSISNNCSNLSIEFSSELYLYLVEYQLSQSNNSNNNNSNNLNNSINSNNNNNNNTNTIQSLQKLWSEIISNLHSDINSKNYAVFNYNSIIQSNQNQNGPNTNNNNNNINNNTNNSSTDSNIIIFTCSHSYSYRYFNDTIIPQFIHRMSSSLNIPLPITLKFLLTEYNYPFNNLIQLSCPNCAFNTIINEQKSIITTAVGAGTGPGTTVSINNNKSLLPNKSNSTNSTVNLTKSTSIENFYSIAINNNPAGINNNGTTTAAVSTSSAAVLNLKRSASSGPISLKRTVNVPTAAAPANVLTPRLAATTAAVPATGPSAFNRTGSGRKLTAPAASASTPLAAFNKR